MKTSIFVTLLKNVEFLKTNFVTSNHKLFHLFCVTLFFINYFLCFSEPSKLLCPEPGFSLLSDFCIVCSTRMILGQSGGGQQGDTVVDNSLGNGR